MAWGGARPGSGPKPRTPRIAGTDPKTGIIRIAGTTPISPREPRGEATKSFAVTRAKMEEAILRSRGIRRQLASHPVRIDSPFSLPVFPPGVKPPSKEMALDSIFDGQATGDPLAWAAGISIQSAWQEGIGFLGYTYLAELTQRPEYRVISEVIAGETTRKGIELTVAEDAADGEDADGDGEDAEGVVVRPSDQKDPEKKPPPGAQDFAPPAPTPGGEVGTQDDEEDGDDLDDDEEPADPEGDAKKKAKEQKNAKLKELAAELDRLKVMDVIRTWGEQDGWFGRSHIYIDTGDGDKPEELKLPIGDGRNELSVNKVAKGALKGFKNIEPIWCYPANYNSSDPTSPLWYKPDQWIVMAKQMHATRLLTLVAREVPDILKPAYAFGGLSMSQMAKPYIDNWLRTRQSVSDIVSAFSVMVLETDLAATLAVGGDNMFLRAQLFNNLRDNLGIMMTDKESEGFSNVSAPLGTLDALQAQSQEHMCSVARIPVVKLLGIQPAGLNASSEGEISTFDDNILAYQEKNYRTPLMTMIGFAQLNIWGKIDPAIGFKFVPLRQPTPKEEAEIDKAKAEAASIRIGDGVIAPEEERAVIVSDPESPYAGLDPSDVPEPPMDDAAGGFGEEPGKDPFGGAKKEGGATDAALPFGCDALWALDDWSESEHPRGQPGNAGQFGSGGGGTKQKLKMPQYGLTPTPRSSHQHKAETGGEFFEQNWHKAGSVGGHSQPSPSQVSAYTSAYENQGGEAPLQPSALKRVGKQMGSNPGGVFETSGGKRFYVKQGQSKEHVANELAAAELYGLAGSPTLKYRPVEGGGHIATEMSKLDKDRAHKFTPAETKRAQQDFVTHAWLANWDAVGLEHDNLGTVAGVPTSLDMGGAMLYRGMGQPKGAAFGNKVEELNTLRNPGMNSQAASVFGSMTPDQVKASAEKVTKIPDDKIRDVIKSNGLPDQVADTLIARKQDIAKRVGLIAHDAFEEAKHPRVTGGEHAGEFASAGGGEGTQNTTFGKKQEEEAAAAKKGKSAFGGLWKHVDNLSPEHNFKHNVNHVLGKKTNAGSSYRQMLEFMIKEAPKNDAHGFVPELKKKLGEAYSMAAEKATDLAYAAATSPADAAKYQALAKKAAAKAQELGVATSITEPAKPAPAPKPAAPPVLPPATPAEMEKAKKPVKLQLQYVPGAPQGNAQAQKLVDGFNSKWEGKQGLTTAQLTEKVHDFKQLTASMAPLQSAEQKAQAEKTAKAAAEQAEKNKAAAAALQAQQAASKAKNKSYMVALGISETEATGFDALVHMLGKDTDAGDLIAKFQGYKNKAAGLGYPISGFQYALIRNYIDGGYAEINKALRSPSLTAAQHVYARMVNNALDKMPKYAGVVKRGATLTPEQISAYQPGHVVEHRSFTSTGIDYSFGGNVNYTIKANGQRGADFSKGANTNEKEVLFKAHTFFMVHKVEQKGNTTHIEMEEVESHG